MKVGMRVLSFCHYLQGPAATQYLADMGAGVIKIEPLGGAFERRWSGGHSSVGGVSAFLLCANRNKRSLAIDLKHPDARAVMDRLIADADVSSRISGRGCSSVWATAMPPSRRRSRASSMRRRRVSAPTVRMRTGRARIS